MRPGNRWVFAWVLAVIFSGAAQADPKKPDGAGAAGAEGAGVALPMGTTATHTLGADGKRMYSLDVTSAGVLSVAVNAVGGSDLVLSATDADGQPLSNGRVDGDLGGSRGTELLSVVLPYPGTFRLEVGSHGTEASSYVIGATWLAFAPFERAPDPDARPGSAIALTVGQAREDAIDGSAGDDRDWFAIRATSSGMLTVITRAPEGDLVLELYDEGAYVTSIERSDQDIQGVRGNEAITLLAESGKTYYIRVAALVSTPGRIPYTLTSGLIPQ